MDFFLALRGSSFLINPHIFKKSFEDIPPMEISDRTNTNMSFFMS